MVRFVVGGLALALALGLDAGRVDAQVSLADDIILASKQGGGEGEKPESGETTSLGLSPGSGADPFRRSPGTSEILLGIRDVIVPSSITRPESTPSPLTDPSRGSLEPGRGLFQVPERFPIALPSRLQATNDPSFGDRESPEEGDEGPPHGLTLDAAIEHLVRTNLDLRTKFFEIPMAQADELTSGLRSNPLFFYDSTNVPYGSYSSRRPGDIEHGISIVYPVDYSGKRRARIEVSRRAKQVLEAQYQDAVRMEIDNLYTAFVDALAARDAVRAARLSLARLDAVLAVARARHARGERDEDDYDSVHIERDLTSLLVENEEGRLRTTKRRLATLLSRPLEAADGLELSGSLRDRAPPPPPVEELIRIAWECRPDLVAHRLGVCRARADAALARADRLSDAYLLYTPYSFRDNSQEGLKSATAWGAGLFISLPIYDRNQGNIRRARLNLEQTETSLAARGRQVIVEVQQAAQEYVDTRRHLQRLEQEIFPAILRKRDKAQRRFQAGAINADSYLSVQRDLSSVVRHYRDSLVRHRRSMLALNTAVGLRILP